MLGQSIFKVVQLLHLLEVVKHCIIILKLVSPPAFLSRRSSNFSLVLAIAIDQFLALQHLQLGLSCQENLICLMLSLRSLIGLMAMEGERLSVGLDVGRTIAAH